jgi:hypothetical protein
MARPDTTNFILEKLREVGIIKKDEAKLNQEYTGYDKDFATYMKVCRSYLIDYYCAVLTDQERVDKLEIPAVFDTAMLDEIKKVIIESSINTAMLQSYLEKKRLSCERAEVLGFPADVITQCSDYIKNLETFLEYVPENKFSVDVSFVGTLVNKTYRTIANKLRTEDYLKFYLKTDLPKHAVYSSFTLEEAKELVDYQTKIDELKTKGGFAISFGNGRDGYKTSFELLAEFIQAKWNITNVEMLYPDNITFSSIKQAPTKITGKLSILDKTKYTVGALKSTLEESDHFNGTMLITLKRGAQTLTIWTLASRDDFHDIAFANQDQRNPDELIISNNTTPKVSSMRKSIYTTDLYHIVRYAIEMLLTNNSTLEFQTEGERKDKKEIQPKQYLYPSKVTSFTSYADIEANAKNDTRPAILLDRFNTAFTAKGTNKIHIFATLPQPVELPLTSEQIRYVVATMKTIAYANRLRYPKAVKVGGRGCHKSQRHHP